MVILRGQQSFSDQWFSRYEFWSNFWVLDPFWRFLRGFLQFFPGLSFFIMGWNNWNNNCYGLKSVVKPSSPKKWSRICDIFSYYHVSVRNSFVLLTSIGPRHLENCLVNFGWNASKSASITSIPNPKFFARRISTRIWGDNSSLHLTLTARDTFFLTKWCCRLIFKPSFPFS